MKIKKTFIKEFRCSKLSFDPYVHMAANMFEEVIQNWCPLRLMKFQPYLVDLSCFIKPLEEVKFYTANAPTRHAKIRTHYSSIPSSRVFSNLRLCNVQMFANMFIRTWPLAEEGKEFLDCNTSQKI